MSDLLSEAVERFVGELTPAMREVVGATVPGVPLGKVPADLAEEAFDLAAAFIDVDGRQSEDELWAFIGAFARRLPHKLPHRWPADVRAAGLIVGKRSWLAAPSLLFDVLVETDRANGTANACRYYDLAMALAHAVCASDAVPSEPELAALERYRSVLLRAMERAGLTPPGSAPIVPTDPPRPLEELFAELDSLIGLAPVKAEVKLVANLLQVQRLRRSRGLPVVESSRHLVFTGNPGTGKTTVARLLAQIFQTLEVVERGHLVETDRSGLVAGYVGQTALKVRQVFDSALGGVLLIDEAYALARGADDFGVEAVDTLVKLMEDHRHDVVVIVTGYPEEMHTFVESNPGLRSRFPRTIHFPDYTTDELLAIFESMCEKAAYTCTPGAREAVQAVFDAEARDKGFGNARLARNLFEAAVAHQAGRVVGLAHPTNEQLMELLADDVPQVPL